MWVSHLYVEFVIMDVYAVFRDHVFAVVAPRQIPFAMCEMNFKIVKRDVSATDDKQETGRGFFHTSFNVMKHNKLAMVTTLSSTVQIRIGCGKFVAGSMPTDSELTRVTSKNCTS